MSDSDGRPTGVTVRVATLSDLDAVVDLWVALVADQRQYGAHLKAAENRETARDFMGQYVAVDGVIVAERAGEVVGFVNFRVETGAYEQDVDRGIVDNVYVEPAHRDEGIGSALLEAAEDALADRSVDRVAVSAMAANDAARRLYESRGYEDHRVTLERSLESDTHSSDADE